VSGYAWQCFVTPSAIVREYLKQERFFELSHPPFSQDLAPYNFFLFPRLAGGKYQTQKELGSAISQSLNSKRRKDYEKHLTIRL
jgi:hypothetical protein